MKKVDFQTLCSEAGIAYRVTGHEHCHEGWIQVNCPFCGDAINDFHLGYSVEKGNMNCWRCGSHSLWSFLKASLPHAISSKVTSLIEKNTLNEFVTTCHNALGAIRKRNIALPRGYGPLNAPHVRYLRGRGYEARTLEAIWGLVATNGMSGVWNWRIIAPIWNLQNQMIAYAGRSITKGKEGRWRMCKNEDMLEDPKKVIYGIHKASKFHGVLIVEGQSDVWRMGPGCVATCGIDWKEEQASILKKFDRRYIMFDPEKQAQERARKLAVWFSGLPGTTEIITGIATDPGDLEQKEADKIMKELNLFKP